LRNTTDDNLGGPRGLADAGRGRRRQGRRHGISGHDGWIRPCHYKTLIQTRVPRLDCSNHGVKQVRVPWAEDRSRFTALFEALAIDWMKQAPISAVAERLRVSWDEAAGIQRRAVERGLARRQLDPLTYLGVDETSFRRGHDYVSIVSDLEMSRVLYVADDRKTESLDGFWNPLPPEQLASMIQRHWDNRRESPVRRGEERPGLAICASR
jgi:transposase